MVTAEVRSSGVQYGCEREREAHVAPPRSEELLAVGIGSRRRFFFLFQECVHWLWVAQVLVDGLEIEVLSSCPSILTRKSFSPFFFLMVPVTTIKNEKGY